MASLVEEQNTNSAPACSDDPAAATRLQAIRDLNDRLRTKGRGGMVLLTNGIGALGIAAVDRIFAAIAGFDGFSPDNDPWGEHDCAGVKVDGQSILWKIDYYDRTRTAGSPDPADPKVTVRVMTVMLADEY